MFIFQKPPQKSPLVNYSRSKDVKSNFFHRVQDKTLYNSSTFNVYLYKTAPNRTGTPIKAPKTRWSKGFVEGEKSEAEKTLTKISRNFGNLPVQSRKKIVEEGIKAPIRMQTALPQMSQVKIRKIPFIMNDFHIRETNPGFARNALGGFFTR